MTSYSGSLSVTLAGFAEHQGSFTGGYVGSYVISGLTLGSGGALSGSASGNGTVTVTVNSPNGTESDSVAVSIPPTPIVTTLSAIGLPLTASSPAFGIV